MKKQRACKVYQINDIYNEVNLFMYKLSGYQDTTRQNEHTRRENRKISKYEKSQKSKSCGAKICTRAIRYFCNFKILHKFLSATGRLKIFISNITQCQFMLNYRHRKGDETMGIVQKIQSMSESGELRITANYYKDDNQMDYPWYYVTYLDPDWSMEITSEMPTLKQAIESVYASLQAYNAKINAGNASLFKGE